MENKPICEIDDDGNKRWYNEFGLYHREDGPAVEFYHGGKQWWVDGQLHRLDGPAVEYKDGTKEWHVNGKLHRLDGPAKIYSDGDKEWFINDSNVTDIITDWANENDIDIDNLTEDDKLLIKLVWADYSGRIK